jgi:glycosyltransferase involved in cell wall biosynthesis
MTSRPLVLLVCPWAPYPYDGGSKRILTLVRLLSERFRFRLLTTETPSANAAAAAEDLALEARHLRPVFEEIVRVPFASAPPDDSLPEDVARWRQPALDAAARKLARGADLVHCEYELTALAAENVRGPARVLTLHDLGEFRREDHGRAAAARRRERARRAAFLRRVCRSFDRVVVMTEPDRRRLLALAPRARADAAPTGVDLDAFAARRAEPALEPPTLAFVGHYPHYPNEDALIWFLREAWPRVRAARPDARFLAIGSSPTEAVRRAADAAGGVEVTGTVESVRPWLAAAHVFVAPLRLGEGIKGKVLEAFSVGVPVIATPLAARGLGARSGRELVTAGTAREFADAALALLGDPARRGRLAAEGRRFAERRYDWRECAGRLGDVYDRALARRRGA